ncbi:monovalent cation/H+ antiporter complex subunit F [Planctomycetota bacterium]|nr:monovalent cation/H+ antiporter complex subunit F [Planctomycetota bacterium]
MFLGAILALLVATALVLIRAFKGPTVFDRILAMNSVGTKAVILVALLGFATERPDFLDIALTYALINFVTTIAILKLVEHRGLHA